MGRFGGGRLWVGGLWGKVWRLRVVGWRSLREGLEVEGYGLEVFRVEV